MTGFRSLFMDGTIHCFTIDLDLKGLWFFRKPEWIFRPFCYDRWYTSIESKLKWVAISATDLVSFNQYANVPLPSYLPMPFCYTDK